VRLLAVCTLQDGVYTLLSTGVTSVALVERSEVILGTDPASRSVCAPLVCVPEALTLEALRRGRCREVLLGSQAQTQHIQPVVYSFPGELLGCKSNRNRASLLRLPSLLVGEPVRVADNGEALVERRNLLLQDREALVCAVGSRYVVYDYLMPGLVGKCLIER